MAENNSIIENEKKNNSPKEIFKIILGAIVLIVVVFGVLDRVFRFTDKKTEPMDVAINKQLSQINEMAPMMVSEYIRFDNVMALPGKVIQYKYTIVNETKNEIDFSIYEDEIPTIVNQIKTTPRLADARSKGFSYIYMYYDKNGEYVGKLSVTPDMYK